MNTSSATETRQLPCYGGPSDGETRGSWRLWLGFPGPWVGHELPTGYYMPDPWDDPVKFVWVQWVESKEGAK